MKIENPLILTVETSGRQGSVAIAQGATLLAEKQFSGPMRHSAEIFPAIVALVEQFGKKPVDIEQVYISIGPGSFTGLRIAATIAKSMALANGAKIVAVDTLDVVAANVISFAGTPSLPQLNTQHSKLKTDERLAVILDAKRSQFFVAVYEQSEIRNPKSEIDYPLIKIQHDCLMTADEFLKRFADTQRCVGPASESSHPIALIGEGLVYYRNNFNAPDVRILDEKYWNPSAANVHKLGLSKALRGEFTDPIALTPNYIRGPDAKVKQI